MKNIDPSISFAQRILYAINYCREHRSSVNDIFYFSSLKHVEKSYLDANLIPVDIAESIKDSWCECYKSLSKEVDSLSSTAREHLDHWQDFLVMPSYKLH